MQRTDDDELRPEPVLNGCRCVPLEMFSHVFAKGPPARRRVSEPYEPGCLRLPYWMRERQVQQGLRRLGGRLANLQLAAKPRRAA